MRIEGSQAGDIGLSGQLYRLPGGRQSGYRPPEGRRLLGPRSRRAPRCSWAKLTPTASTARLANNPPNHASSDGRSSRMTRRLRRCHRAERDIFGIFKAPAWYIRTNHCELSDRFIYDNRFYRCSARSRNKRDVIEVAQVDQKATQPTAHQRRRRRHPALPGAASSPSRRPEWLKFLRELIFRH